MKKMFLLFCLFSLGTLLGHAQEITTQMKMDMESYNAKINELIAVHTGNGFHIKREERLPLVTGENTHINIQLVEGHWYHFAFVGDPSASTIKVALFLDGIGEIISDRVHPNKEQPFWTEFSYICPRSGLYELSLMQKTKIDKPLSYILLFEKTHEQKME